MGIIRKRVDDYLYNTKGEEVDGARKVSISIPGIAFGGVRAKKHELDMSEKGERAHAREREKIEEQTRKLWASYLKNVGFNVEANAPKDSPDSDSDDSDEADTSDATESSESTSDEDLSEEDLEAATSPSEENFGSNNF